MLKGNLHFHEIRFPVINVSQGSPAEANGVAFNSFVNGHGDSGTNERKERFSEFGSDKTHLLLTETLTD